MNKQRKEEMVNELEYRKECFEARYKSRLIGDLILGIIFFICFYIIGRSFI